MHRAPAVCALVDVADTALPPLVLSLHQVDAHARVDVTNDARAVVGHGAIHRMKRGNADEL